MLNSDEGIHISTFSFFTYFIPFYLKEKTQKSEIGGRVAKDRNHTILFEWLEKSKELLKSLDLNEKHQPTHIPLSMFSLVSVYQFLSLYSTFLLTYLIPSCTFIRFLEGCKHNTHTHDNTHIIIMILFSSSLIVLLYGMVQVYFSSRSLLACLAKPPYPLVLLVRNIVKMNFSRKAVWSFY